MRLSISLIVAIFTVVQSVTVNIPELGTVLGITTKSAWSNKTIYQFFSLKFALSTSGNRRFQPPEPIVPWEGIYNATVPGIECPQVFKLQNLLDRPPEIDSEDCLSLNLFTPKLLGENATHSDLLPVMVYIHGGGFYEGSSQSFPPNYLLDHEILLVVPQYRLGPLGYLSLQTEALPGNVGFLDQVLALEWVNKYIMHFGGDNSQVTIFGQSAGACSISFHLLSPAVQPYLFQKAIVQSGSSYADWAIDTDPTIIAKDLFKTLTNITDDVDNSAIEEALINAPLIDLMSAVLQQVILDPGKLSRIGRGVIQKAGRIKYLTENPADSLKSGNFRTLPMMAGVTKHDGSFLLTSVYDGLEMLNLQDDDQFLRKNATQLVFKSAAIEDDTDSLVDIFNNNYFKKIFDEEKNITFRDVAPGLTDIFGVLILKAQTLKQAKINANHDNKTYVYTLDYRGEHTRFGYGEDTSKYPFDGGVHHSDDLLYLFPFPYNTPLNNEDTIIAKTMSDLWTSFAINGEPSSSSLQVNWEPLKKGKNGPYLHINATSYLGDDFVSSEYFAAA